MASPEKLQAKQRPYPVLRLMVADGVRSSCSPVKQCTFTQPLRGGTGVPV